MYLDGQGRCISPSMVSQYTPPSPPMLPQPQLTEPAIPPLAHSAQWFGDTGAPTPIHLPQPSFMPTPMLVPASSVYGDSQDAQHMVMPVSIQNGEELALTRKVVWPMSLGMYPSGAIPSHLSGVPMQRAAAPETLLSTMGTSMPAPAVASAIPTLAETVRKLSISESKPKTSGKKARSSMPGPSIDATEANRSSAPAVQAGATKSLSVTSSARSETGTNRSVNPAHPRVVRTSFKGGVFTPHYDPDELKEWQVANGIQERSPPPAPPADSQPLPLLPLRTGGHDPASTTAPPPPLTGYSADNTSAHDPYKDRAPGGHYTYEAFARSRPSGTISDDDQRRLDDAVARQTADSAAREQIRAQIRRDIRLDSPSGGHKLVPVPVPFSTLSGPSPQHRYDQREGARGRKPEPRTRSPKERPASLPFIPNAVRQKMGASGTQSGIVQTGRGPAHAEGVEGAPTIDKYGGW